MCRMTVMLRTAVLDSLAMTGPSVSLKSVFYQTIHLRRDFALKIMRSLLIIMFRKPAKFIMAADANNQKIVMHRACALMASVHGL